MSNHLKLRRDFEEPEDSGTLKFPVQAGAPSRRPGPAPRRPRLAREDEAGGEGERDTVITSDELVRQIESTLDRMQNRLSRFKQQLNHDMKFPVPLEEGPPPKTAA